MEMEENQISKTYNDSKQRTFERKIYIIPKNYNIEAKFLGIIDYKLLVFLSLLAIGIYYILNLFTKNLLVNLQILILIYFPIILLILNQNTSESPAYIIWYMLRYLFIEKVYVYNPDFEDDMMYKEYLDVNVDENPDVFVN